MRRNLDLTNRMGSALSDRLAQPVNLRSAYVQQPGAYSGGGLPFPIGVTAQDPALSDPSLLSLPGLSQFAGLFDGLGSASDPGGFPDAPGYSTPPGASGVQPGEIPGINYDDPDGPLGGDFGLDGGEFDNFYQPSFDARSSQNTQGTTDGTELRQGNAAEGRAPRRRSDPEYGQLVRADDLLDGNAPGDDLTKAMGSVQLLMEAMRA